MTAVKDLRTLTKNLDSNGNETANVYITGTATENPWTTLSTGASEVTDWKNLPVSKAYDNKTTITKVWEGAGQDSAKFYIIILLLPRIDNLQKVAEYLECDIQGVRGRPIFE